MATTTLHRLRCPRYCSCDIGSGTQGIASVHTKGSPPMPTAAPLFKTCWGWVHCIATTHARMAWGVTTTTATLLRLWGLRRRRRHCKRLAPNLNQAGRVVPWLERAQPPSLTQRTHSHIPVGLCGRLPEPRARALGRCGLVLCARVLRCGCTHTTTTTTVATEVTTRGGLPLCGCCNCRRCWQGRGWRRREGVEL